MIVGFIGNMGGGKTLSMVRQAYNYHLQGFKIFSNIKLNFPYEEFTGNDLLEYATNNTKFKRAIFLVDEAHIFLDSRRSASKNNLAISYFILQTRKKDVKLLYTTQNKQQVDIRLRQQTDIVVLCYTRLLDKAREIRVTLNLYQIKMMEGVKELSEKFISNDYYDLYDTYEVINPL